jgi:hypothetical protein
VYANVIIDQGRQASASGTIGIGMDQDRGLADSAWFAYRNTNSRGRHVEPGRSSIDRMVSKLCVSMMARILDVLDVP